ncbi:MAG TPA: aminopeptidase P family N-terminal domain-containing protein, partial [Xanthobacteraceae bacterium]
DMRRGLIAQSRAELPDAVLDARIARVRAAMDAAGLDALLLYTNNTRPAAVSWLTGFVPYWSEALLILAGDGLPLLVAALTYRVKSWIERTSRLADVLHTPRIGLEAAHAITARKADARVGVPDLDALPAGICEDLRAGGPGLDLRDASAMFARLRVRADTAEIAFAARASAIAQRALAQPRGDCLAAMIAAADRQARALGAEEVYVAAAPDLARDQRLRRIEGNETPLGATFALRATVAYQGTWIRLVRTFARAELVDEAARVFAAAAARLPDTDGFAGFRSWLVEGCRIAQPLEPLAGTRVNARDGLPPGALVSVQGRLELGGGSVLVGAPALLGASGEAASLLLHPSFD